MTTGITKRILSLVVSVAICLSLTVLPAATLSASAAQPATLTVSPGALTLPLDFLDEYVLLPPEDRPLPEIRVRVITDPVDADTSDITLVSSNPSVASVTNDGVITLLSEGTTSITAICGNITSNACTVTVTAPENRSKENRNLLNLPPVEKGVMRINVQDHLAWPENYGDVVVALWDGNRTGAFSSTADDGIVGDIANWQRLKDTYGIPVTYFLIPARHDFTLANWTPVAAAGHDMASHSKSHPETNLQHSFTSAEYIEEYYEGREMVNEVPGADCRVFASPNTGPDTTYVRKFYIAGRGGDRYYSLSSNVASPYDYMQVGQNSMGGSTNIFIDTGRASLEETMVDKIRESSSTYGGWGVTLNHNITGAPSTNPDLGANTTGFDVMNYVYANFAEPNKHLLWADAFTKVAMYAQERDSAEVNVTKRDAGEIRLTVSDILDDRYFDYPLTLKVKLSDSWTALSATQNGEVIESEMETDGINRYALVKAIPDRGEVVIRNSGEVKTFSNNAKLSKLEYIVDGRTTKVGADRLAVTGFKASDESGSYDVLLPPGTTSVSVFATPADSQATATRSVLTGVLDTTGGTASVAVTVEAEDKSENTYTVNFTVEQYDEVTGITLSTPENLIQNNGPERTVFTATTVPGADRIDASTVKWYVNDELQDATGLTFEYTPVLAGNYVVYAKAGDAVSDSKTIEVSAGEVVATRVLYENDMEDAQYVVGYPVPVGTGAKDWTRVVGNDVSGSEKVIVASDPVQGKVIKTTNAVLTDVSKVGKLVNMTDEPLIVSAKMRVDASGNSGTQMDVRIQHGSWSTSYLNFVSLAHNTQIVTNRAWGAPNWTKGQWVNVVQYIDPTNPDENGNWPVVTLVAGEGFDTAVRNSTVNYSAQSSGQHYIEFTFSGNNGPMYADDLKVYVPGSFTMSVVDETGEGVDPDKPIRVNFSHHANLNTLTKDRVIVTGPGNVRIPVESITTDKLNPDYFEMNFADGALMEGTVYTVGLDSEVRDAANKALHSTTTFRTEGGEAIEDNEAPTVPSDVTASSITSASAEISWGASTDNLRLMGYKIYNQDENTLLATVGASAASVVIDELKRGTTYNIGVSAYDSRGNESDRATVTFTTKNVIDDVVFFEDDFESYTLNNLVPRSETTESEWGWNKNYPDKADEEMKFTVVEEKDHGKVAKVGASGARLSRTVDTEGQPIVVAAKVRSDSATGNAFDFNIRLKRKEWSNNSALVGFGHNGQMIVSRAWQQAPRWSIGEWLTLIAYVEPNADDYATSTVTVYMADDDGYHKVESTVNLDTVLYAEGKPQIQLSYNAGTNPADVYVDDVEIYRPGSFIMEPEKATDVPVDEPVRINFNHHVDMTTFGSPLTAVTVTGPEGNVQVVSVKTDKKDSDYFTLTFAQPLEEGEEYTVSLATTVLDIAGQPVAAPVTFTTEGEATEDTVKYGDANGDGNVNSLDRAVTSRFIAKWENYTTIANIAGADVNTDGNVNSLDRAIIARHIAKWAGYDILPKY